MQKNDEQIRLAFFDVEYVKMYVNRTPMIFSFQLIEDAYNNSADESEIYETVGYIAERFLRRYYTLSYDEKNDIVQNVLIRFWKKLKSRKINANQNIDAYIRKLTKTEAFGYIRSKKSRKQYGIGTYIEQSAITECKVGNICTKYR